MKYLILLALLSFNSLAEDKWSFELDLTQVEIEHAWRGPDNYAQFDGSLSGVGVTSWHDSGFGARLSYLQGKDLSTEGKYEGITIQLKYIAGLELLYKHRLTESLWVYGGIGTYLIPLPMDYEGIDPDGHDANDSDNDEGWLVGAQWDVNERWSVGWKFTHYSRIKSSPYDEWTKGHSLNITYKF